MTLESFLKSKVTMTDRDGNEFHVSPEFCVSVVSEGDMSVRVQLYSERVDGQMTLEIVNNIVRVV